MLTLGLHETGEAGWRNAERKRGATAQNLYRGVDVLGWLEDVRVELDVTERLHGAVHADLFLSGTVGVVERGGRGAALSDLTQIAHGQRVAQTTLLRVELGLLELQQIKNLVGVRELTANHLYAFL